MDYPYRYERTATAAELRDRFADLEAGAETGATASLAGRLRTVRTHGKLAFADLQDASGRFQLFAQQAALMAAKQEVTKELQQVIQEGNALMKFLREGLKAYLGKDNEKLTEFGVQPFRGIVRRVPKTPLPETVAPSDLTPDSVK